jgi:hypothetical protein
MKTTTHRSATDFRFRQQKYHQQYSLFLQDFLVDVVIIK